MKKYGLMLLALLLVVTGCTKSEDKVEDVEDIVEEVTEEVVEEIEEEASNENYLAFLKGNGVVIAGSLFEEDDEFGNFDGIRAGSYTLDELKELVEENTMSETTVKYAINNLGHEDDLLIVHFENVDPSFTNWTCFIKDTENGLELEDYYEDGYRTQATLYQSGGLITSGSYSAASGGSHVFTVSDEGKKEMIIEACYYYGLSAEEITYPLSGEFMNLMDSYYDIATTTNMYVRDYVRDGKVKMSVSYLSNDEQIRSREEEFIGELETLGAVIISDDEMDELWDFSEYQGDFIIWNDLEALRCSLKLDYADGYEGACEKFVADEGEYAIDVLIAADKPVTDVKILSLSLNEMDNNMTYSFHAEELYSLDELTPEKPLVVKMVFTGAIPSRGIYYVDDGVEKVYAINVSGMDDSLIFEKVKIK